MRRKEKKELVWRRLHYLLAENIVVFLGYLL